MVPRSSPCLKGPSPTARASLHRPSEHFADRSRGWNHVFRNRTGSFSLGRLRSAINGFETVSRFTTLTRPTYTSTGADVGFQLSVRVTAHRHSDSLISLYVCVRAGGRGEIPAPLRQIRGMPRAFLPGDRRGLRRNNVASRPRGLERNGPAFLMTSGSPTASTLAPTVVPTSSAASDLNEPITVSVTATKTEYNDPGVISTPAPRERHAGSTPCADSFTKTADLRRKPSARGSRPNFGSTSGSWSLDGFTYSYLVGFRRAGTLGFVSKALDRNRYTDLVRST